MENGELIGEIKKTNAVKTKIRLVEFKGRKFLDVRDFFRPKNGPDFTPTKKGVMIDIQYVPTLVSLVEQAEAKIVVDKKQ